MISEIDLEILFLGIIVTGRAFAHFLMVILLLYIEWVHIEYLEVR